MHDDRIQTSAITGDDWLRGDPAAPVIILEYGDFECPYCAAARPELEAVVASRPQVVRMIFRHFPIASTHPHATLAAEAAEAAGSQGRFWEMHDLLFTHQSQLEPAQLMGYARDLKLDMPRFEHDLATHQKVEEVRRDFRRGVMDGVNGTPTLFINRERYDGPRERTVIMQAVALAAVGMSRRGAA